MESIPQAFARHYPLLNVADFDILEDTAGPGRRLVLWLQGCLKRCPNCCNQDFLPLEDALLMAPGTLLEICRQKKVEGISLSGGEPFLQAISLSHFLKEARAQRLSVFVWTGYVLEELQAVVEPKEVGEMLACTDILVDGPYREEEKACILWRGSRNQCVYFLSDRYSPEWLNHTPKCALKFSPEQALLTGDISEEIFAIFREKLEQYGISIKPKG